jgi:hypothetical protein
MRNMTPFSQALAVLAITSGIIGYKAAALAIAVVIAGLEIVVSIALAEEEDRQSEA